MKRDYPPGVILHTPDCAWGGGSPAVPPESAYEMYPWRKPHGCFDVLPLDLRDSAAMQALWPLIVVEVVNYGRHAYEQSNVHPDDATRPLCRVCRGTHGDEIQQTEVPSGHPQRPDLIKSQ